MAKRAALSGVLRFAQLTVFMLFLSDTYCYSILDPLLGWYLGGLGLSQTHLSLGYATYGMLQIAATVAVLLLQLWPVVSSFTLAAQCTSILAAAGATVADTVIMVLWPASYALLVVARSLQGMFSAVYFIYTLILIVDTFPPAYRIQTIACMTAGRMLQSSRGRTHCSPMVHCAAPQYCSCCL